MTAFDLENGIDEIFGDETQLTPDQAKTLGAFRAMVWDRQKKELEATTRAVRQAELDR
jgi:hypothetical protein